MLDRVAVDPRRVVELACLAPSIRNSQPWTWRVRTSTTGSSLDLYADPGRLRGTDPRRDVSISCGAALDHAATAARALGLEPTVTRYDGVGRTAPLARVDLRPGPVPLDAEVVLASLRDRCTDRRRFTAWPVPEPRLDALAALAAPYGVRAQPVTDVPARVRLDRLVSRALALEPGQVHPGQDPHAEDRELEGSDGVIVLGTTTDEPMSWLRVGEALSALWLDATAQGLSVVPLSQVVEVPETRSALQHEVLDSPFLPQIMVRVGWQELSRLRLPHTPRRLLGDVLRP